MKKTLISVVLCLTLLLALALPAMADTPWSNDGLNVYLLTSFDNFGDGEINFTQEPFWVGDQVPSFSAKWENGALVFYEGDGSGAYFRIADTEFNGRNVEEYLINATGMGFYVENNGLDDANIDLFLPGFKGDASACYAFSVDTVFELVSIDGEIIEGEVASDNSVYIPSGFKGYVNFELDTLQNMWGGGTPWDPETVPFSLLGFNIKYLYLEEGETFVIDNVYIYGTDIPHDNYAFDVVPAESQTPTQAPTDEPTEGNTAAPTDSQPGTSGEPQATTGADKGGDSNLALIIGIAGGVVLVAGVILLVVVLTKKKGKTDSDDNN